MFSGLRLSLLVSVLSLTLTFLVGITPEEETCGSERCDTPKFDIVKLFRSNCPHHLHDTKCALRLIKQIQEWLKKYNKYRILLTGKMGTGKTTLIKGLRENYMSEDDNSHNYVDELNVVAYDMPGLKDTEDSSNGYEYLKDLLKKNEEPNLIIFAVKMSDLFREDDAEAIGNISNAFGWRVWKKAMFVLTFANMVTKVGYSPENTYSKLHFNAVYNEHYYRIVEVLRSNMVHEYSQHVVPVGLVSKPKIPSDKRDVSWIDELWEQAFKVLRVPIKTYDTVEEIPEESESSFQ